LDKRSPTVIMEPNNDYWNPTRIPKVRIKFDNIIAKAEAIDEVIKGGKIDIVTELTPAEAMKVSKSSKAGVVESRAKTVLVGVFNQNKSGSKWKNKELRQAINHAVDKNLVLQEGHLGYGTIMPAMITGGSFGYNSSLYPYAYEPKKAQAVLKEAGIKDFVIATGAGHKAVADSIAKNLSAVGISAKVDTSGSDGWDIKLVEHFDWSPDHPYGVVHREFFGQDGGFRSMPVNKGFEDIGKKIVNSPDNQESLTRELEAYVHEQAFALFLYAPSKLYAVSNRVNFTPYRTTVLELAETTVR